MTPVFNLKHSSDTVEVTISTASKNSSFVQGLGKALAIRYVPIIYMKYVKRDLILIVGRNMNKFLYKV